MWSSSFLFRVCRGVTRVQTCFVDSRWGTVNNYRVYCNSVGSQGCGYWMDGCERFKVKGCPVLGTLKLSLYSLQMMWFCRPHQTIAFSVDGAICSRTWSGCESAPPRMRPWISAGKCCIALWKWGWSEARDGQEDWCRVNNNAALHRIVVGRWVFQCARRSMFELSYMDMTTG